MEGLENVFDSGEDSIFDETDSVEQSTENIQDTPIESSTPEPETEDIEEIESLDDIFEDSPIDSDEDSETDAIDDFLASHGIKNSQVSITNEEGEVEQVDFHSLDKQDQLDILNSFVPQLESSGLAPEEEQWLNELQREGTSINEFLELYRQSILEEVGEQQIDAYDVDNYNDMELFLLDLKERYDLSDEELQAELEKELKDEEMFGRKVGELRKEYKKLEDQYRAMQEQEFENRRKQEYQNFSNQMMQIAENKRELHGFELEDEDKHETLSYMLDLDQNGKSQLAKDLDNPETLYNVAWYLKYGNEAFKIIEDAYEAEIAKIKKNTDSPKVVRQKPQNKRREIKNINELY